MVVVDVVLGVGCESAGVAAVALGADVAAVIGSVSVYVMWPLVAGLCSGPGDSV